MITLKMTLPAMERLLQDDMTGEIKTEISNQILDNFANKHLRSLLNDERIKKLREEINLSIDDEISKIFGKKPSYFSRYELNKETKELIKEHSKTILIQTILDNTDDFKKSIESKLDYEFTKITKKLSKIEEDFEIKINSLTKELEDEKALNDRLRKLIREELSSLFQK